MAPRGGELARERALGVGVPRTDRPRTRSGGAKSAPAGAPAVPGPRPPPDRPDGPGTDLSTVAWKFSPPPTTARTVHRRELVARLRAARDASLVVVSAPSGLGKTTLLAQWAATDRRAVAWLTADARDADPPVFLRHVAAALSDIAGPAVRVVGRRPASERHRTALDAMASALHGAETPFVLAIDDAHLLADPACGEAIVELAEHLPRRAMLVVAGRGLDLPIARLRAQGRTLEVGSGDLAMAAEEAGLLLAAMDLDLSAREVDEVVDLTEGWPAALHLAGLMLLNQHADRRSAIRHLRQSPPLVDYVRSELLTGLRRGAASFLLRSSVLRTLSGPLCDAVLERSGSARLLEGLARRDQLLVPLDQRGERYRTPGLLRRVLRTDLERREPDRVPELLRRAARWCVEQGLADEALEYARDLGDADMIADLLTANALELHRAGRADELEPWFAWFEERDLLDRYPIVAAQGAWMQLLRGRAATVQRWADAAERGAARLRGGERTTLHAMLGLLRAAQCRTGPRDMERDAERAMTLLPGDPDMRAGALLLQAVARRMQGAGPEVDPLFVEAFEIAVDRGAHPAAVVALTERAILAIEQDDWLGAKDLVDEALELGRHAGLEESVTAALPHAVAARIAIQAGDLRAGKDHLAHAHRLRARATHAVPFLAVQVRLEMAHAYGALTDSAGARTMLRELESLFALRRDLGVLRRETDAVHVHTSSMRATFVGGSSLTTAELRLLPLLATHYSFREIADQLFVSRHTIKTQAISIYRKLRVTSRSEAVESAREAGLLGA